MGYGETLVRFKPQEEGELEASVPDFTGSSDALVAEVPYVVAQQFVLPSSHVAIEGAPTAQDIARCPFLGKMALSTDKTNKLLSIMAMGQQKLDAEKATALNTADAEVGGYIFGRREPDINSSPKDGIDNKTDKLVQRDEGGFAQVASTVALNPYEAASQANNNHDYRPRGVWANLDGIDSLEPKSAFDADAKDNEVIPGLSVAETSKNEPKTVAKVSEAVASVLRQPVSRLETFIPKPVKKLVSSKKHPAGSSASKSKINKFIPSAEVALPVAAKSVRMLSPILKPDIKAAVIVKPKTETKPKAKAVAPKPIIKAPAAKVALHTIEDLTRPKRPSPKKPVIEMQKPAFLDDPIRVVANHGNLYQEADAAAEVEGTATFNAESADIYDESQSMLDAGTINLIKSANYEIQISSEQAPPTAINFQKKVISKIESEEPVTIESIQKQVNQQSLEETFVQLAAAIEVAEPEEASEIKEAIKAIKAELEAPLPIVQGLEAKTQMSQQATEKLVILLAALGHEKPRDALKNFTGQYSLSYLSQVLQYVSQLDDSERKELLTNNVGLPSNDDRRPHQRIGQIIFALMSEFKLAV